MHYRLSKAQYADWLAEQRRKAMAAAMVMREKAKEQKDNPASALRFTLQALARLKDFVEEPVVNDIYSDLELILGQMRLAPIRRIACAVIGEPLKPPIEVVASCDRPAGEIPLPVPNLPVAFAFTSGEGKLAASAQTDPNGLAQCHVERVISTNPVQTVRAAVDICSMYREEGSNAVFARLLSGLTAPEAVVEVRTFRPWDKEACLLGREFAGRDALVLCAYEADAGAKNWPKLRDEIAAVLRASGASVQDAGFATPADIVKWSGAPIAEWKIPAATTADVIVIVTQVGKLNRRKDENSPLGEDCSMSGQVRSTVAMGGKQKFSDNYDAIGGWNPLGEEMCVGVQAIQIARRWKAKYLQQEQQ